MTKTAAAAVARQLADARHILLTAHRDPDGDSLGCQLAFYEYWTRQRGRTADVINQGTLPSKYRFLDPQSIVQRTPRTARNTRWDCVIVFECSALDRIGSVARLVPPDLPIINIDHHGHNDAYGAINIVDPAAAACGEMVYDLFRHWKADITPAMASNLAVAILTDTGRFYHPCTNVRTLEITAALMRRGANLTELATHVYHSLSQRQFRLIHHILGRAELRAGGKICFLILSARDRQRFGVPMQDLEGLVDDTLSVAGVRVGALLRELAPRRTKASLRSANSIDVAAVARQFGGGGHRNAAGCVIERPLREAADLLAKTIGPMGGRAS
ncbi:MAG TPA: bifunctional oligoribonuclease/PAP phosphatase NrnA [Acidobacteriota bacterium]|nr:bifunctional oligoribonuclease/PAP phosphatase NrnA [Acidobacteriota bacterium]